MQTANAKIETIDNDTLKVNGRIYTVEQRTGEAEFKAAYPHAHEQLGMVGLVLLRGQRGAHRVLWSYSDGSVAFSTI